MPLAKPVAPSYLSSSAATTRYTSTTHHQARCAGGVSALRTVHWTRSHSPNLLNPKLPRRYSRRSPRCTSGALQSSLAAHQAAPALPDVSWLFGIPSEIQTELDSVFGSMSPIVTLVLVIVINAKIQEFRREQEMKAAAAAGRAVSEATKRKLDAIPQEQWQKLALCVVVDVLGDSSFLLPGLGEAVDVFYAPLEAFFLARLFRSNAIATIGLVEEGLPFTDAIPTATLAWVLETFFAETWIGKLLGLEQPEKDDAAATEIDDIGTSASSGKKER